MKATHVLVQSLEQGTPLYLKTKIKQKKAVHITLCLVSALLSFDGVVYHGPR